MRAKLRQNQMKQLLFNTLQDPKLYQYTLVGGLSACVDIAMFLLLNQYFTYHFMLAATISFVFATLFNYLLCNYFLFKHQHKHSNQKKVMLVYLVSGVGLLIHHSVLFTAASGLALPIVMAKILAMGSAFGWNFLSRKHFVFAVG